VPEPVGATDQDQAVQADQTDEPAAQADAAADQDEAEDPGMPVFHRMWSSPTPPEPLA
jgi:hypothetical protein